MKNETIGFIPKFYVRTIENKVNKENECIFSSKLFLAEEEELLIDIYVFCV